jgi:hypothetical protein
LIVYYLTLSFSGFGFETNFRTNERVRFVIEENTIIEAFASLRFDIVAITSFVLIM